MDTLQLKCEVSFDYEPGCKGLGDHPDEPENVINAVVEVKIGSEVFEFELPPSRGEKAILEEIENIKKQGWNCE